MFFLGSSLPYATCTFLKDARCSYVPFPRPSEHPGCNGVDLPAYWRKSGTISPIRYRRALSICPREIGGARNISLPAIKTPEAAPMGVDNENFDGDADMQGGVVHSDVTAEDPAGGSETKSRRAVSV